MVALEWGVSVPSYEHGVDQGVVSFDGAVRPWNGLISVEELEVDSTTLKSYFDGFAYVDQHFGGVFQAVVTAYNFVDGIEKILGLKQIAPGFFLTGQQQSLFDFSYRTMITEADYKIHLVYNAMATPTKQTNSTLNQNARPDERRWRIDTVPPTSEAYKPTSHVIVDSTKVDPDVLIEIEKLLYGDELTDPSFPSQQELIDLFEEGP